MASRQIKSHADALLTTRLSPIFVRRALDAMSRKPCFASIRRFHAYPVGPRPACTHWPCGLMDKALVFGTKDCRFESCQGHFGLLFASPTLARIVLRTSRIACAQPFVGAKRIVTVVICNRDLRRNGQRTDQPTLFESTHASFSRSAATKVEVLIRAYTRGGTRTRNLLLRREAPYPLGHTSNGEQVNVSLAEHRAVPFSRIRCCFCARGMTMVERAPSPK